MLESRRYADLAPAVALIENYRQEHGIEFLLAVEHAADQLDVDLELLATAHFAWLIEQAEPELARPIRNGGS